MNKTVRNTLVSFESVHFLRFNQKLDFARPELENLKPIKNYIKYVAMRRLQMLRQWSCRFLKSSVPVPVTERAKSCFLSFAPFEPFLLAFSSPLHKG